MSQIKKDHVPAAETVDKCWKSLYKLGGVAASMMVAIILIQFIVFILWPPPLKGSILTWFTLFQDNWLRGLLSFELLMIIYTVLSLPLALALYVILKRVDQSFTAVYLLFTIVGVITFITARPAFEMLFLSNQHTAAATDVQKSMLLAAGEGMLAVFNGTAFYVSYVIGSISGLIISIIMLKSNIFSKAAAYMRIISSVLDFGLFVPTIGIFLSMFSVVFLLIWHILIGLRLFQLGRLK